MSTRGLLIAVVFVIASQGVAAEDDQPLGERKVAYTAVVNKMKILDNWKEFQRRHHLSQQADKEAATKIKEQMHEIAEVTLRLEAKSDAADVAKLVELQTVLRLAEAQRAIDFDNQWRANFEFAAREIHTAIKEFAAKHDIAVVLNENWDCYAPSPPDDMVAISRIASWRDRSQPMDAARAKAMFQRPIVYQNNLDITYDVVDALNNKFPK